MPEVVTVRRHAATLPLAIVLVLAAALRIATLVHADLAATGRQPNTDAVEYVALARNLVAGHGFSQADFPPFVPDTRRTPVFPALLAAVLATTGDSLNAALLVCVGLGVLNVWLTWRLARMWFGPRAAGVAALVIAIDVASIVYSNLLLTETAFTALLLAAVTGIAAWIARPGPSSALRAGLWLGFAALCRPIGALLPAAVAPTFVWWARLHGWRRASVAFALFVIAFAVPVGVWTLRNAALTGSAVPASIGAVNLYFHRAAYVQALLDDVDVELLRARWEREFVALSEGWSEPQKTAWLQEHALAIIWQHPVAYVRVYAEGLARMFGPEHEEQNALFRLERASAAARLLTAFSVVQLVIVYILAAWGALAGWREAATRSAVLLFVSLVLYFVAVSGPEAYARFRVPVMPLLAVLAGRGSVRTAQA